MNSPSTWHRSTDTAGARHREGRRVTGRVGSAQMVLRVLVGMEQLDLIKPPPEANVRPID